MVKKVLLIGHCGPDSSYVRMAVRAASPDAQVTAVHDDENLGQKLHGVDLVLVNRVLDGMYAEPDGIELIRRHKKEHAKVKFILVSNYAEAQAAAVEAGALPGFGKRELGSAAATDVIKNALE